MTHSLEYQMMMSPEAKAIRAERTRQRAEGLLGITRGSWDPLAERQRIAQLWSVCPWHKKALGPLPPVRAFYRNRTFRDLVLPRLQAFLTERERASRAAFRAELHRQSVEWEHQKALKLAAKRAAKLPQKELFA